MALNPVDIEILDAACGASTAVKQQLDSKAVLKKLTGISEEDFYDSLEILERSGYVERSREIAPRPPSFSLTALGIRKQLEEDGLLRRIQIEVEEAIANKSLSKLSDISADVNHSTMFVAAILDFLEERGDIRVRHSIDGEVQITQVSATVRRRAKELDY